MRSAIVAARNLGIDFTMACNTDNADKDGYEKDCQEYGIKLVHIDFDRNPLAKKNQLAARQLLRLVQDGQFDIIHCNTPIGGVLGRICAKKAKVPYVIYQAHGFHFWKGAPVKNWVVFYPIEKLLARYTDLLITINNEDYQTASKFKLRGSGRLVKISGVGVEPHKWILDKEEIQRKKDQLGLLADHKVFISVGELNENKNHITAIEAISLLKRSDWVYLICGDGELLTYLQNKVIELGLTNQIKLLGFRMDVPELLEISDVFVFPSKREGLSAALMEAMEVGLPCIAGKIRGNTDLLPDSQLLFNPNKAGELTSCLEKSFDSKLTRLETEYNLENIKNFEFDSIVTALSEIYHEAERRLNHNGKRDGTPGLSCHPDL